MISLVQLLREAISKPKAIVMAGAASSGKSTLAKKAVIPNAPGFEYINPDTYIESGEMSLGQASTQVDDKDVPATIESQKNFIWDTTAANAAKMLGGLFRRKQVPGLLNNETYDFLMIMVYVNPIVSFLRNFERERKVPKVAILSTWNKVYGNIDAFSSKLGDNFVMYQAPIDPNLEKKVKEFEQAYQSGNLEEYFDNLIQTGGDKFTSTFRSEVPDEDLSPEELEKRQKSRAKTKQIFDAQVKELATEFGKVQDKVDKYIKTEEEIASKVKQFVKS